MTHTVFPALAAIAAWFGWHVFHEALAEVVGRLLRPIAQPIWRAFVVARWRLPILLAAMPLGVIGVIEGFSLLSSSTEHADTGLALFFGGAGLFLLALILWHETKREAAIIRALSTHDQVNAAGGP